MPYHKDLPHPEYIDNLDDARRKAIVELYLYAKARADKLRNLVIGSLIVMTIGCGFGIQQGISVATDQHKSDHKLALINSTEINAQKDKIASQCWNSFNGRITVRALVGLTIKPPSQELVNVGKKYPIIAALLKASANNEKAFVKQAYTLLPIGQCPGHNPTPVSTYVLKLANLQTNVKQ